MRVCMATTSYPRQVDDPAGHFVRALARRLVEAGVHVTVLAPGSPGVAVHENDQGVCVRRLTYFLPRRWQRLAYGGGIPYNLAHDRLALMNMPSFMVRFGSALAEYGRKSDLIHAHWCPLAALASATRCVHRRSIVLTAHGSDLRIDRGPIRVAARYAVRTADFVLTPSPGYAELAQSMRCREPAAVFSPVGMDLPLRETVDAAIESRRAYLGPTRIVTVGRLIPERRFDLLLQAVSSIDRRAQPIRLFIVGDGPERSSLERLATQLGLTDIVSFIGRVAPEEVGSHLREADLYVSPTSVDNFGTAVVEAASYGLPAIVTRVGFPAELAGDEEAGMVVEPASASALSEAIRDLIAMPDRLPVMGRAMRNRLESMGVDFPTVIKQTLDAYRHAMSADKDI